MPRAPRLCSYVPGAFVHVISRFVDGRFFFDDVARTEYRRRLAIALRRSDWRLLSYAFMGSHIHIGLLHGFDLLVSWIRPLHVGMAQWINRRRRKSDPKTLGHVFADRPATLVYSIDDSAALIAYHHNNPGNAKVVTDPRESTWTSHRAYVGIDAPLLGLDVRTGLELSGFDASEDGRKRFHSFVQSRSGHSLEAEPLPSTTSSLDSVALITRQHERSRLSVSLVARHVASSIGVSSAELHRSRRRSAVAARRITLRVWSAVGGSTAEMARFLGISSGAASRLLSRNQTGFDVQQATAKAVRAIEAELARAAR